MRILFVLIKIFSCMVLRMNLIFVCVTRTSWWFRHAFPSQFQMQHQWGYLRSLRRADATLIWGTYVIWERQTKFDTVTLSLSLSLSAYRTAWPLTRCQLTKKGKREKTKLKKKKGYMKMESNEDSLSAINIG